MVIPYFMRKHEVFNFLASVHLFVHILFADYCYSSVENASSLKYYGLFSIVAGGNCMDGARLENYIITLHVILNRKL